MPINTATATIEDVRAAETRELVELYNKMTDNPITKFSDRKTAESRVWKMIQQLGPDEDIDITNSQPAETETKKREPKKRETAENRIIQLLVQENTKQPGSRAHKKFEVLMKHDGKTIKEFKACEGKYSTLDDEAGWPATELRWAVKLNLAKLIKVEA